MSFKWPGGDLNWLLPLMIFAGSFLAYSSFTGESSPAVGVLMIGMVLCSALIFFQVKFAAWPLLFMASLGVLGGTLLLILKEFTWLGLLKVVSSSYFVAELWSWMRTPKELPDQDPLSERFEI